MYIYICVCIYIYIYITRIINRIGAPCACETGADAGFNEGLHRCKRNAPIFNKH